MPFSPVPAHVTRMACAIARYNLLGDSATERARNDYQDARTWLRDVQAGRALIDAATTLPGAAPAAMVEIITRDKVFNGGMR